MQEKIHLYYTNDLHSDFTHWPKVASFLKKRRENCERRGISSLLFDIGDHMDRVDPIAEAFKGRANVELLNDLAYDCVTIGNNEGITLAAEELDSLYNDANFDVVVTNMRKIGAEPPHWLKHISTHVTNKQTRIGVVGLTAAFNPFYNLLKYHIDEPAETLEWELKHLRDEVDVIVLLSHLGLNEDRRLAQLFPGIDVIIGGHTHHILQSGEVVDQTILTAAGKNCSHVGEVILTFDHALEQVVKKEAYAINITHLTDDKETVKTLEDWNTRANEMLEKPVVIIDEEICADPFKDSRFLTYFTHTLQTWTNSDCAMLNAGILVESFSKGTITYKDIHRACPHPINPCVVAITGGELLEIVRATFSEALTHKELKGFGFRGNVIGVFSFAGIEIKRREDQTGSYIHSLLIQGKSLEKDRVYKLATVDMFTFGRLLPEIARSPNKNYFVPEMIRDVLTRALKTFV